MHYELYFIIFVTKIIENALGTLRMIVVANGKKILGAVLNGIISFIWLAITGLVIVNVSEDPLKVLFFCLGCVVGSYLGNLLEEKIALGNNMLMVISDINVSEVVAKELRKLGYTVTVTNGENRNEMRDILIVMIPRKKTLECVSLISSIDLKSMIVSLSATSIFNRDKNIF